MKNKEPNLNRDREFAVILESIHSDFRIFGEGLSAIQEKVGGLSGKVGSLSDKVDGIFEMTGKNTENIAFIKTDIRIIRTDLKAFEKRTSLLEQNFSNN